MVSVIIPVYNGETFLEECLRSVMEQSYRDLEIIVVDDGSRDRSYQIATKLAEEDDRIRVLHQENAGVSAARNRGLEIAKGQYIMFVDADDVLLPNALNMDIDDEDLVIFDMVFKKGKRCLYRSGLNGVAGEITYPELIQNALLEGKLGYSWGNLYKQTFLKEKGIKFEEGCIQKEDADFNFAIINCFPKVRYINKPIYQYNYSTHTAMNRWRYSPEKMISSAEKRFVQQMEFLEGGSFKDYLAWKNRLVKKRIKELYWNGIDLCCTGKATSENKKYIERLMKEIGLPADADDEIKKYYYIIANGKWKKIWIIAKLRLCYLHFMKI